MIPGYLRRAAFRARRALARLLAPEPCEKCGETGHTARDHYPLF